MESLGNDVVGIAGLELPEEGLCSIFASSPRFIPQNIPCGFSCHPSHAVGLFCMVSVPQGSLLGCLFPNNFLPQLKNGKVCIGVVGNPGF